MVYQVGSEHGQPFKGQLVGYKRVSSLDQDLARQDEALKGCDRTFEDHASGKDTDRPGLQEMLRYVRSGDVVRVLSPDRLARSTLDLLKLVLELSERRDSDDPDDPGVRVEFVDMPALNTTTAEGRFTLTVLGAVAELEREMIRKRQAQGIAVAKAAGKYARKAKLSPAQIKDARNLVDEGVPKAQVAREMGVSRPTLYDALNGRGRYADEASS